MKNPVDPVPENMRMMTPEEAAGYLGTTVRHIRRLVSERRLAHHKVGRFVRFDARDLDSYLVANAVPAVEVGR